VFTLFKSIISRFKKDDDLIISGTGVAMIIPELVLDCLKMIMGDFSAVSTVIPHTLDMNYESVFSFAGKQCRFMSIQWSVDDSPSCFISWEILENGLVLASGKTPPDEPKEAAVQIAEIFGYSAAKSREILAKI
jgi:hypothetical protein